MRVSNLLIIGGLLLNSVPSVAAEERCKYKTYERFLLVEKSGHRVSRKKPDKRLSERMTQFEIYCPFQIEVDLNGDKKKDWVGLVSKDGQYSLLAYVSGPKTYQIINLQDYPFFPEETHINIMTTRELSLISGNKKVTRFAKFALITNRIDKLSHAYAWDGKTLSHLVAFKSQY